MLLSTDAVAITQSLYLHQSADRISKACAAMLSVGLACRRSQIFTLQSPEALMNTSACAGFLQATVLVSVLEMSLHAAVLACGQPASRGSSVWPAVMSIGQAYCTSQMSVLLSLLCSFTISDKVLTMLLRTHSRCAP